MKTLAAYDPGFARGENQRERRINVGRAEAWGSMISGGLLAAYGLARRSPLGWAAALAGGALVYRGTSRHRPAFQLLGINTARHSDVKIASRTACTWRKPRGPTRCSARSRTTASKS